MHPQRFHHLVLVVLVRLVEGGRPLLRRGDDPLGIALAEFDLCQLAHAVLVLLEQVEQRRDALPVDLLLLEQRAVVVGDAINAAVFLVAIRVAQMMLHVADDVVRPVGKIDRTIRSDVHADGTEVRQILGLGRDEMLQRLALETRAFLRDLHAKDALEADDVDVQKISLELLREMPAAEDTRAGTRT